MQRKIFCALFVCATLLLMAPVLMAEENTSEKTIERAAQILEIVEVQQTEVAVAPNRNEQAQAVETNELGLPVAPVTAIVSTSLSWSTTCQPCSTHADCASVCGGGQPFSDYICHWTAQPNCSSHLKQCSCN